MCYLAVDHHKKIVHKKLISIMDEQTDTDSSTKDRLVSQLQRLNLQIEVLQAEVTQLRLFGSQARKRRKDEVGQLRLTLTGKSGLLWLKMQKMRRFGNLTQCKNALTYQRNPEHDTSPKTLTAEAKLLLALRQGAIIDRQSEIIQKFQKDTIEYLYTTVLPNIKDEQKMATVSRARNADDASTTLILSVTRGL
jgi:hypothetical protein